MAHRRRLRLVPPDGTPDDDDPTGERSLAARAWRNFRWHTHVFTIEQELTRVLSRVGPVVAIGRPGDSLPELGAARLYARDDEWRAKVSELMLRARLVVIRAGPTPGLQWEIEEASRLLPPERVVLVSPPQRPPQVSLWHAVRQNGVLDAFLDRFTPTWAVARAAEPIGEIVLLDHTSRRDVVPKSAAAVRTPCGSLSARGRRTAGSTGGRRPACRRCSPRGRRRSARPRETATRATGSGRARRPARPCRRRT